MIQPFPSPHRTGFGGGSTGINTLQPPAGFDTPGECGSEPPVLTYRQARAILHVHDVHGPGCRQWLAAAAYLSAGLNDD